MSQPKSSSSTSAQDLPSVDALLAVYADKHLGECFEFGCYPQGANGEIEPITWRVLLREADHLLVIAEQCLDCQPYHEELCDITWADCTLRRWLNDEFMNVAFNEQERKCILKTSVDNNEGPDTADYVFLLSDDEASDLFANDRTLCAKPTRYSVEKGADIHDCSGCCWWWLRSSENHSEARVVSPFGETFIGSGCHVNEGDLAVRPVVRVALPPEPCSPGLIEMNKADRAASLVSLLRTIRVDKQVGQCFEFGRYPQGANGEIKPITWRVLERETDHLLVIAANALDCQPYHKRWFGCTWAGCTLRRWLNDEFMNEAFNEQEQQCILKNCIANNAGPQTADYIFLLSVDEAGWSIRRRAKSAKPTEYAVKNGVKLDKDGYCHCWLRSRGYTAFHAVVDTDEYRDHGHYVRKSCFAV